MDWARLFFRRRVRLLARSVLCAWLALAGIGDVCRAEKVHLADGTTVTADSVSFSDGKLRLSDGRILQRADVKKIVFDRGSANQELITLASDLSVPDLLRASEAAEAKWPDANAIFLIDVGENVLRDDGTQFSRSHYAVKILKDDWKSLAEIGNSFEEGRDRVTLVRARIIDADGKVHDFDPADLTESKAVQGVTSYDEHKTVSGHLPNVQVGSIVEVVWDSEIYNPYDKELFHPAWHFALDEPSVWSKWTVTVPLARELHFRKENMPQESSVPVITETATQRIYVWEMRDLDRIEPEPGMPPMRQVAPSMYVSTHSTWDHLYDFLGKFQREHMQLTPAIEQKVTAITSGSSTPEDKVAAIYHWLQREIRYVSIKGSMGSAWSGHPASLTLENGYGDCIDKAVLFATMLQAVDIESYPVLLATNNVPADDRSLPRLFANHAINKVKLGDRVVYLDTTAQTFRYPYFRSDDHGVTTINVLERKIGRIDVPPPSHNAIQFGFDMAVNSSGDVTADIAIEVTGAVEAAFRQGLEQVNDMMLKMVAQQAINALSPGAQLESIKISKKADLAVPLTISLKIAMPGYASFAGPLMIVPLPVSEEIHQFPQVSLDERQYDIDYKTSGELRQNMRLEIPEGYEAKGLPKALDLKTPHGSYRARYSREGRTIVFEGSLRRTHRIVPQSEYQGHKEFLERVADYVRKPIFLMKAGQGPT